MKTSRFLSFTQTTKPDVIRASPYKERISDEGAVRSYKQLTWVERAFRSMKTMDPQVRVLEDGSPVHSFDLHCL